MPSWKPQDELTHPVDFTLVSNGSVTLFWRQAVLEEKLDQLVELGYHVVDVDFTDPAHAEDPLAHIGKALDFPSYFSGGLNGFNDCLRDVACGDLGWPESALGLVLVLRRYDAVVASDARTGYLVLDRLAYQARRAILMGNRVMVLAQSDDPDLRIQDVGAEPVLWNGAEWLDSNRRP